MQGKIDEHAKELLVLWKSWQKLEDTTTFDLSKLLVEEKNG